MSSDVTEQLIDSIIDVAQAAYDAAADEHDSMRCNGGCMEVAIRAALAAYDTAIAARKEQYRVAREVIKNAYENETPSILIGEHYDRLARAVVDALAK
jgi:hypothetical protein